MTKDYKQASTEQEPQTSYLWMLSGMTIGLLVGLGMFFFSNPQEKLVSTDSKNDSINQTLAAAKAGQPDPIAMVINNSRNLQQEKKHATFTYFGVLPNLERDVQIKQDARDKANNTINPREQAEAIVAMTGDYLLQIASFRKEEMAKKTQADLQSQGLGTRIEQRKVRGNNWYRIVSVPFQLEQEVQRWKKVLEVKGHHPLLIKLK